MKNSLACVIFKEKKSTIFSIILKQLEKWENYKKKRCLTRKSCLFYSVESKLFLISKYNKTNDKVFRGKNINNHKYRFFDSIIFKYIFSIKMMETIPDQLESCRYYVCVQKQLKFGMIKGVSFFSL